MGGLLYEFFPIAKYIIPACIFLLLINIGIKKLIFRRRLKAVQLRTDIPYKDAVSEYHKKLLDIYVPKPRRGHMSVSQEAAFAQKRTEVWMRLKKAEMKSLPTTVSLISGGAFDAKDLSAREKEQKYQKQLHNKYKENPKY